MQRTSFNAHEIEVFLRAWLPCVWLMNLEPVSIAKKCLLNAYSVPYTVLGFEKVDERNKICHTPMSWSS